jgi:hypothetical protein
MTGVVLRDIKEVEGAIERSKDWELTFELQDFALQQPIQAHLTALRAHKSSLQWTFTFSSENLILSRICTNSYESCLNILTQLQRLGVNPELKGPRKEIMDKIQNQKHVAESEITSAPKEPSCDQEDNKKEAEVFPFSSGCFKISENRSLFSLNQKSKALNILEESPRPSSISDSRQSEDSDSKSRPANKSILTTTNHRPLYHIDHLHLAANHNSANLRWNMQKKEKVPTRRVAYREVSQNLSTMNKPLTGWQLPSQPSGFPIEPVWWSGVIQPQALAQFQDVEYPYSSYLQPRLQDCNPLPPGFLQAFPGFFDQAEQDSSGKDGKKASNVVYVKGIEKGRLRIEQIANLFECFGDVEIAMLHSKKEYAMVKFTSITGARNCIKELYGKEIGGKSLLIHFSELETLIPKFYTNEKVYYTPKPELKMFQPEKRSNHISRTLLANFCSVLAPPGLATTRVLSVSDVRTLIGAQIGQAGVRTGSNPNEYFVDFNCTKAAVEFVMTHNYTEFQDGIFVMYTFAGKSKWF